MSAEEVLRAPEAWMLDELGESARGGGANKLVVDGFDGLPLLEVASGEDGCVPVPRQFLSSARRLEIKVEQNQLWESAGRQR
jgi:hypothetical protein